MTIKREGWIIILGILALMTTITVMAPLFSYGEPLELLVRLCALYGVAMLAIATIMTPFLKEFTHFFGKSFLRIHHIFAIFGIIFVTLHPTIFALRVGSLAVFIPRFDTWEIFWRLAGRPALYILYIAVVAALLRGMAAKYWRPFHALMYVVLFFAIVHGNLIGTDFQNLGIWIIFNILFVVAILGFILKRYRNYQLRKRTKSN